MTPRGHQIWESQAIQSLKNAIRYAKKIIFYGAGLQLIWILYLSGINLAGKDFQIIDDNEKVHGRFMPGTRSPIGPFNPEFIRKCNGVDLLSTP